jgi:hypothetical protein
MDKCFKLKKRFLGGKQSLLNFPYQFRRKVYLNCEAHMFQLR